MLSTDIPAVFNIPWAASASAPYIHAVPEASQIAITPGAASLTDGFPPLNFLSYVDGGVPPFGNDWNGILNQITAWLRWGQAGGVPRYDAAYQTAIGGYPNRALLLSADGSGWWLSTADDNMTNPETGGANWTNPLAAYAALAGANFTGPISHPGVTDGLGASAGIVGEYASATLTTAGAITTNVTADVISIALSAGEWEVWATVVFGTTSTTTVDRVEAGISLASVTRDTTYRTAINHAGAALNTPAHGPEQIAPPHRRIITSVPVTAYLYVHALFGTSTMTANGSIFKRRIR